MSGRLFIITGPSGVGKTAVAQRLLKSVPNAHRLVTYTTREPRPGETDGVDYHFVQRTAFETMIKNGEMFEWDEHYGHLYGNRIQDVEAHLAQGGPTFYVVDVAGAKTAQTIRPDAVSIFLVAPAEVLRARIEGRGKTDPADMERRLACLPAELAYGKTANYTVENLEGKLDETEAKIRQIIEQELAKP